MDAAANKQLIKQIFDELAKGNSRPYFDALADDFTFTVTGRGGWAGTYAGKDKVREFFRAVGANYADAYTIVATHILSDGDWVAVEARGCVTTVRGDLYDNQYCLLFRIEAGRLKAGREYADTALVDRVLDPPPAVLRQPAATPVSA